MEEWKVRDAIAVITGMVGGVIAVMSEEYQIAIVLGTGFIALLIIFLWPKKVIKPRRRIYKPDPEEEKRREEVEKIIAEHQAWWDKFENFFVEKGGWKVETVNEWEYVWLWDKYLPNRTKWPWE